MVSKIPPFYSIFVSYDHVNIEWCKRFVAELRRLQADVWYDEFGMRYGTMAQQIEREIACRPVFICLLSWASHDSVWVRREYTTAVRLTERQPERVTIPVQLEECGVPFLLSDQLYESAMGLTPEETAHRIAARLAAGVTLPNGDAVRQLRDRARHAATNGNMEGALAYYGRALDAARESRNCAATVLDACADRRRYGNREFDGVCYRFMHDKDSPIEWNELGDAWRRAGEWHDALVAYSEALFRDSRSARGWAGAGEALLVIGEYGDAASAFGCALAVNPHSSRAWQGRGDVQRRLYELDHVAGHAEFAAEAYERALTIILDPTKLDQFEQREYGAYSGAYAAINRTKMLDLARGLASKIALLRRHGAGAAAATAASSGAANWEQWQDTLARVEVLTGLGRYHEALSKVDEAVLQRSDSAVAWFKRGLVLSELDRFDDAEQAFDRVVGLDSRFVDALTARGHALYHLGRHLEALGCLQRVLDLIPNEPIAQHLAGSVLRELDRLEESLRQFDTVLESYPEEPAVLVSKSKTLQRMGKCDDALSACQEALVYDPGSREAQAQLEKLKGLVKHSAG